MDEGYFSKNEHTLIEQGRLDLPSFKLRSSAPGE